MLVLGTFKDRYYAYCIHTQLFTVRRTAHMHTSNIYVISG